MTDPENLSHVRADGSSHMVDVTGKDVTAREARAQAVLRTRADVVERIAVGDLPKGEAIPVARIAGIQGAKRTSELIPLCHPLPLSGVEVEIEPAGDRLVLSARVRTTGVTGVEMEALTAVTTAALTLYDMIKAVDRSAVIEGVQVLEKSGGKSGRWRREAGGELREEPGGIAGRARVIIASTRASRGEAEDRTGPELVAWLEGRGLQVAHAVVPDGDAVGAALREAVGAGDDLVITSGGTGITPDDRTPEQTAPLLDRELPGVLEALRSRGSGATPSAVLSRGLAGMAGRTAVVNLPGSPGGVRDGIAVLDPVLEHLLAQRDGGDH